MGSVVHNMSIKSDSSTEGIAVVPGLLLEGLVESLVEENLRSEHLEGVAPAAAVHVSDLAVEPLREGVGEAVVEVVEYLGSPVVHRPEQLEEVRLDLRCDASLPPVVEDLGLSPVSGPVPNLEESLFQLVGESEVGEVPGPRVERDLLVHVEFGFSPQKDEPAFLESSVLCGGDRRSGGFPATLHGLIGHTDDVKFVHHDIGVRHDSVHGVSVRVPHINRYNTNLAGVERGQELNDVRLVALGQHFHDGSLADIGDDAAGLDDVNLVNPHDLRSLESELGLHAGHVVVEDVADGLLVHTNVLSDMSERPLVGLRFDMADQAACHTPIGVHVAQVLEEGGVAGTALHLPAINEQTDTLTSDRRVEKQVRLSAITDHIRVHAKTVLANLRSVFRLDFELDVVLVFVVI